jgi:hypothetical protein
MARGKLPQEAKVRRQVPLEELVDWLLPQTEVWTWEEAAMSMPYSSVQGWIKILRLQRRLDRHVFQGPPDLSGKMEARWSSTTAPETTSPPST